METSVPVPLEPCFPAEVDDRRLWIGNLDSRLSEYNLIKILQKYGKVLKFDYLFHKSGLLKGQPRGYCFVTYETREEAEKAMMALNGKLALSKKLVVKWANTEPTEVTGNSLTSKNPLLLSSSSSVSMTSNVPNGMESGEIANSTSTMMKTKNSVKSQISAIEAKLKAMEQQSDLDLGLTLSTEPSRSLSSTALRNKTQSNNINSQNNNAVVKKRSGHYYQRHKTASTASGAKQYSSSFKRWL